GAGSLRSAGGLVGQVRLPGPGRADDDEEPATAGERIVKRRFEDVQLVLAPDDGRRRVPARRRIARRASRGDLETRILRQDRLLEILQRAGRRDPELAHERLTRLPRRGERRGLPAGARAARD